MDYLSIKSHRCGAAAFDEQVLQAVELVGGAFHDEALGRVLMIVDGRRRDALVRQTLQQALQVAKAVRDLHEALEHQLLLPHGLALAQLQLQLAVLFVQDFLHPLYDASQSNLTSVLGQTHH